MTLLAPVFLWSLLALLPLAAVYFLKVRPRRRPTTAFFLWERILKESKATSLLQRLRDALSLLLMLLAFAAVAFALAQPEPVADERRDLLLVIDRSASMGAVQGGESRLDAAKRAAREIVVALQGSQRAAIASAGRELGFHSHFSRSPRELLDAIDSIQPSEFPFEPSLLDALAEEGGWTGGRRVLLLSDGAFPGAGELAVGVELYRIGGPAGNAGIVAADLRRLPDGRLGFYFRIASSFDETVSADLALRHEETGERIYRLLPLEISPGENPAEVFALEDAPSGRWVATLDLEDALEADNRAYLTLPEPRPVRVRVVGEDRFFFDASVLAFQRGTGLLELADGNGEAEVEIAKGAATGAGEDGADGAATLVLFAPEGESPWWGEAGDPVEVVAPRVLIDGHPVIRHLDAGSMVFGGARRVEPPEGALVLVESEQGLPLIYRASREGRRAVVVNLDPLSADFVLSAWFPVLVQGAALHLAGREEEPAPLYRPGDRVPLPGWEAAVGARMVPPGGGEAVEAGGSDYGPLESTGFYRLETEAGSWDFASTLATPAETLLDRVAAHSASPVARGHSPAYWLLVFAIAILAGESVLYHRRKVG